MNPEHNPPNMIVLPPGVYKHTCPGCGISSTFTVPLVTCSVASPDHKNKWMVNA